MNAEYLAKLSADTHRGLRGRAERGQVTGGAAYGYRITAEKRLEILPEAAAVVRWIFETYAKGASLRELAHSLNRDRTPPPRPRRMKHRPPSWSITALRAILLNRLYKGELVWNRSEWTTDHETNKRKRWTRPESESIQSSEPALAIVTPETWEEAGRTLRRKAAEFGLARVGGRPRRRAGLVVARGQHALSGLCECATFGGRFFALQTAATFGCGWRQKRGPTVCDNALRVPRVALEERVFGAIRERILVPENVLYIVEKTLAETRRLLAEGDPAADARRLREIEGELHNLARFAAKTGRVDEATALYAEIEAERRKLEARLASPDAAVDFESWRPTLHAQVQDLREAVLGTGEDGRRALRALLGGRRMRVGPDAESGFRVEWTFDLALEVQPAREPLGSRADVHVGSGGPLRNMRARVLPPLLRRVRPSWRCVA